MRVPRHSARAWRISRFLMWNICIILSKKTFCFPMMPQIQKDSELRRKWTVNRPQYLCQFVREAHAFSLLSREHACTHARTHTHTPSTPFFTFSASTHISYTLFFSSHRLYICVCVLFVFNYVASVVFTFYYFVSHKLILLFWKEQRARQRARSICRPWGWSIYVGTGM